MGSNMVMQTDTSHVDTRGDHTSVTALEITTSTSGQVSEAWVLWEGQSREEGGALGFGGPGPTLRGWYLHCCGGRAGRLGRKEALRASPSGQVAQPGAGLVGCARTRREVGEKDPEGQRLRM